MMSTVVLLIRIITIYGGAGLIVDGQITRQQEFRQCHGVRGSLLPSAQVIELDDALMDYVLTCGVRCNKDFMCKRIFICLKSFPVCRLDMVNQDEELNDGCYCFDKVHINIPSTLTERTNIIPSQPVEKSTAAGSISGASVSSIPHSINASHLSPAEISWTSQVDVAAVSIAPNVITEASNCNNDGSVDSDTENNDNDEKDNSDDSEDSGEEDIEDTEEGDD